MSSTIFDLRSGILKLSNGTVTWEIAMELSSNNTFHIYSNGNGVYMHWGNTAWSNWSDLRIKRDIHPIPSVLEKLLQLNPVTFNYKTQPFDSPPIEGFIAQEVETLFPSLVSETILSNCDFTVKGISISGLIPYIIKSIQEQYEIEQNLQNDIDALSNKLRVLDEKMM